MIATADTILAHAAIHPADADAGPGADAVAIAGGIVVAVGATADLMPWAGPQTLVIDCGGRRLLPGIVDAHCHPFAAAGRHDGVDCRPAATPTLPALQAALRRAPPDADGWRRGYGYDDSPLGLGRHLNRRDLDAVSATAPVRVSHRSGHAVALNSAGLAAAGITDGAPDPDGGVIVRDGAGIPTGLLLDAGPWLRQRIGSRAAGRNPALPAGLGDLGRELLAYGITALTDAGPDNGSEKWRALGAAVAAGLLPQRVTMMVGVDHLDEMRDAGLEFGAVAHGGFRRVGPVKIMLTASAGRLHPDPVRLTELVTAAHRRGYPVAIHAVERDAVVAAALALSESPPVAEPDPAAGPDLRASQIAAIRDRAVTRDRIEHCGECPPDVMALVADCGARVVANTSFLHYHGERYRATVDADLLPHLYPAGALAAAGIPVALASDAPVAEPNPWAGMAAAVSRRTAAGHPLGGVGLPSVAHALRMYWWGHRIAPGQPADLTLVAPDPLATAPADLPEVRAALTIIGGRVFDIDGQDGRDGSTGSP